MEAELVKVVMDAIVGVTTREIGYMWNFTDNIELLKQEAQNLNEMKGRVQQHIVTAKNRGELLLDGVQSWVDTAGTHISNAERVLQEEIDAKKTCFNNLKHRHHFGKVALEDIPLLVKHREYGKTFETCVSDPAPKPRFSESRGRKNLDGVNTQKDALKKVIEAIKDDSIHIVGIYGAGGVGKTTLAVEVAATVEDDFDCIAFVTVPQDSDVKTVEKEVEKEVEVAATRTQNGEKVLTILDNVWTKLDLYKLGLVGKHKCKILLTCRNVKVCEDMDAQSKICVGSLLPEEAHILFTRVVGEKLETDTKLKRMAPELINECGGSPLIIQVVGNALKNEEISVWHATLDRLKKHDTRNIDLEIKEAFMSMKLSYDLLGTENAKTCFLLCSMFPKGALIPLERLAHYLLALRMFNDPHTVDTIEDARNSVRIAVNNLKSSFLLLNGNDESKTKMHDIVHHVAQIIAAENKDKVLVIAGTGLTEWRLRNNESESYKRISLMQNNICKLPDRELSFPLLDALLIQENHNLSVVPDKFLESLKEARVLDIENCNLSSLPTSLKFLTKLCMLNLGGNKSLVDISVLGVLKDLEILILNDTGIENVPEEIGNLANLRFFEVKGCQNLSHIAQGVISKLYWLEELHIGFYVAHEGSNNSSLKEINSLEKLTFLDLFVMDFALIPKGVNFKKIKGFVVQIGTSEPIYLSPWVFYDLHSTHQLIVRTLSFPFHPRIAKLATVSQDISLKSVAKLNSVIPMLYYGGSNEFRSIVLSECNDVTCLVEKRIPGGKDMKDVFLSELEHLDLSQLNGLDVIWKCQDKYISLRNLTTLSIDNCPKLQKLFPVSVAKGLVNLERLSIRYCVFKSVILAEGEGEQAFELRRLAEISFYSLPDLKSFSSGNFGIKYPALVKVSISSCKKMSIWGNGVHETPKLKFVDDVPVNGICFINDAAKKCSESKQDGFIATATRTSINLDM